MFTRLNLPAFQIEAVVQLYLRECLRVAQYKKLSNEQLSVVEF